MPLPISKILEMHTKYRWLFVGTDAVVSDIKQGAQFLSQKPNKCLNICLVHQTI